MNSRERRRLAAQEHNDAVDRKREERAEAKANPKPISREARLRANTFLIASAVLAMNTQRIDR